MTAERHVDNRRYSCVTAQIHEVIKVDKEKTTLFNSRVIKKQEKANKYVTKTKQKQKQIFHQKKVTANFFILFLTLRLTFRYN